jgi:hypothetical protein
MAGEHCVKGNTFNEIDKGRASSSKIKALAETLGKGKRGGGNGVEEGSTELPSSLGVWPEGLFR